jgi:A/G-specific adenine glycosylase
LSKATVKLAQQVVRWQAQYGRNELPWQNTRDPYRVWLSEIMLQQTQVTTVIGYFPRFLSRFPDVASLAEASLDDVLGLWSGMGYYTRARNLHACARAVMAQHGGVFPSSAQALQALPGIGRSTAAAIASLCFGERVAILDGNVKRVLTRVLGFSDDLGQQKNERTLWEAAQSLVPASDISFDVARYTQGMMDLGATVCLAKQAKCEVCPLTTLCVARREGVPEKYPVKTRKLKRSAESLWLLWAHSRGGDVLLAQRPTPGVWAGLFCLPLFESAESLEAVVPSALKNQLQHQPSFKHVLTHKDLHLHVVQLSLPKNNLDGLQGPFGQWFRSTEWPTLGLPAPVRKLLTAAGGEPVSGA